MTDYWLIVGSVAIGILDRKSTRLNSSHSQISYAGFCLKEKEGWVPDITPAALKAYSKKDIAYILEPTNTPDGYSGIGTDAAVARYTSPARAQSRVETTS